MHLIKHVIWLSIIFGLIGCSTVKKSNRDKNRLHYTFLKDANSVNPRINGFWKSIGNGYYLEAREDSILLYSYTKSFCYKEKNDYLEGLLLTQSQFQLRDDTLSIYLTDFGAATERLQTKKDFLRIKELPSNCMSFKEMTNMNSSQLFDLYLETQQENYAFASERDLNWKVIEEQYGKRVTRSTDEDSLFQVLGEIATKTKDQHTKVISKEGKSLQYRITPSAAYVKEAFYNQSKVVDLNDYFNLFFETNYKNISDSLLLRKGKKELNGKIEWGNLNNKAGYIHIHSFAGFLDRTFTRKQQIDSLNYHMQKIVGAFEDKEAIIIDVSFNFGGYDGSALTVASYFTNELTLSHKSQVYNNGEFHLEDRVFVVPTDSINFTKPVYVLMTDISRSAAEGFAMMMKALPNVKLVGTNTLGTLSGMLGKSIGNFYTTYSNQRLIDESGKDYEVHGVQPDIYLEVFQKEDVFNGHMKAVGYILDLIEDDSENNR